MELTVRSWLETDSGARRTMQKEDVLGALRKTDIYDFLIDILPMDSSLKPGDLRIGSDSQYYHDKTDPTFVRDVSW